MFSNSILSHADNLAKADGFDSLTLVLVILLSGFMFLWSLRRITNMLVYHDKDNMFDD